MPLDAVFLALLSKTGSCGQLGVAVVSLRIRRPTVQKIQKYVEKKCQ
jgi:hypothetical protein